MLHISYAPVTVYDIDDIVLENIMFQDSSVVYFNYGDGIEPDYTEYASVYGTHYSNNTERRIPFNWARHFAREYAYAIANETDDFAEYSSFEDFSATMNFNKYGRVSTQIIERNGIIYGVVGNQGDNGELISNIISWAHYGESFVAYMPADIPLDDAIDFCRVEPMNTWEIKGDAVSVSVQGMESVGIIDSLGSNIVIEDNTIYRLGPAAPGQELRVERRTGQNADRLPLAH